MSNIESITNAIRPFFSLFFFFFFFHFTHADCQCRHRLEVKRDLGDCVLFIHMCVVLAETCMTTDEVCYDKILPAETFHTSVYIRFSIGVLQSVTYLTKPIIFLEGRTEIRGICKFLI